MSGTAVCPGCSAVAPAAAAAVAPVSTHELLLPDIRCAACIRAVETTLSKFPEVLAARVNLTRRRVSITATADLDPRPWIDALAEEGFAAHEIRDAAIPDGDNLVLHLGVAGFAMMNVMLLSVAVWSGATDATRDFLHWVSAAIALPATAFAARPFFQTAWSALRVGRMNMDVPISLAIILACGMSLYEVIHGGHHAWFDAALSLTFFLLAGRVLDQRLRRSAKSAADDLAALEPSRVERVEASGRVRVPVEDVRVGDTIWLAAGARSPVDAVLLSPESVQIDRSALTGESVPVRRSAGEAVLAGEVLLTGPVILRATAVGADSTLRRLADLVATAETARSRYRSLADRAAAIYTPMVHLVAATAFVGWMIWSGDVRTAVNVAIATLIITCPCALGLAVPAVGVAATARLYQAGLLVRSDTALERLSNIDTVVFDKTGTLTHRCLQVPETLTSPERGIFRALAEASDHPLSRTLAAQITDVPPASLSDVSETPGDGMTAVWNGLAVGLRRGDGGPVFVVGEITYPLRGTETPLPDAAETVATLKANGKAVVMLTGDDEVYAHKMATDLGIDTVIANVMPEGKVELIRQLKDTGANVLMVGDGLNDAAALAAADASLAPGTALDASRSAADVVMVAGGLCGVVTALTTARAATGRMRGNFAFAALYNAVSIPLAVLGFATPLLAALAMSTSSITVVLNSIRRWPA